MTLYYQLDDHLRIIAKYLKSTLYTETGEERYYIGANVHIKGYELGLPMYKKIKISVDKILPRMQLNHTSHRTTLTINVPKLEYESDVDLVMRRLLRATYTTLCYSVEYLVEIIISEIAFLRTRKHKFRYSINLDFEQINMNNIEKIDIHDDKENKIEWNKLERSYTIKVKGLYTYPLDRLQKELLDQTEILLRDYIIPIKI